MGKARRGYPSGDCQWFVKENQQKPRYQGETLMTQIPPIPIDPALLRQPDGARFADIPVSFLLVSRYAGDPEMVMAWLVRALAEREDAGLGLPPRSPLLLAATAGLALDEFDRCSELLIRDQWLTRWPDGSVHVPWGRIYEASVEAAWQFHQRVDALRADLPAAKNPALASVQQPLDLS
jgi:hypothetical protein